MSRQRIYSLLGANLMFALCCSIQSPSLAQSSEEAELNQLINAQMSGGTGAQSPAAPAGSIGDMHFGPGGLNKTSTQGATPGNFGQGATPGNFGQGSALGNFGQGATPGNFGQGAGLGNFGQGAGLGNFGQGADTGNSGLAPPASQVMGQGSTASPWGSQASPSANQLLSPSSTFAPSGNNSSCPGSSSCPGAAPGNSSGQLPGLDDIMKQAPDTIKNLQDNNKTVKELLDM